MNNIQDFKDAINSTGLIAPDVIVMGKIIAFAGLDKPQHNKAARCFLFEDGKGGWFMDYSTGLFQTWQAARDKPYSKRERLAFKKQCEISRVDQAKEKRAVQQQMAEKAAYIWQHATIATNQHQHPYLVKKGIQPHHVRLYKGALTVPLYNSQGELINLQFITDDGTKRFLKGGRKKGCFWWLGVITDIVLIAEGFATAASLHESTGHRVVIAFDASNLETTSRIVRVRYPDSEIIVCGDNDDSGTGQTAARAAALAVGGKYILPPVVGTDFNDVLSGGTHV